MSGDPDDARARPEAPPAPAIAAPGWSAGASPQPRAAPDPGADPGADAGPREGGDGAMLTEDRLLGGRVRLCQPRMGYRAATDPVLLAAAVPACPGETVLDLGCGAGAVALCLAARGHGLRLAGLEIDPSYAALARRNAALNGAALEVFEGDIAAPPQALRALSFDHVALNPPFHAADAMASPHAPRDRANRLGPDGIGTWVGAALTRTRPRGRVTLICRTERLPGILAALDGPAGEIVIKPLVPRIGRDAKRVIVAARKGARGPLRLAAPLVLHDGPAHAGDHDDFTAEARAILRDGAALAL